jgi:hypothetical protein
MSMLDVWYSRLDVARISSLSTKKMRPPQLKTLQKGLAKAKSKDSARAFEKLATYENGRARIAADPPLLVPVEDLVKGRRADEIEAEVIAMIETYRATLPADRRDLLSRYRYADLARKVVGVGSVGSRAWVILLIDSQTGAPLFLQAKEAGKSVLEGFAGKSRFENQGRRVVEGQRKMQATSDIFLGWLRATGIDGVSRDFYVRQLWDWKVSADIGRMAPDGMGLYATWCGWTLARAHARTGDAVAIGAYLGRGDVFDRALMRFAESYADQNERDYMALVEAIDSGRVAAEKGV